MKFDCKKLSFSDEAFGCTITFSGEKEKTAKETNMSKDQRIDSSEQYLLLQRTYPEDDFEKDYYYFETNDFDNSGELRNLEIELNKNTFLMRVETQSFEISIHPSDKEYHSLKMIVAKFAGYNGQVLIRD